MWRISGPLWGFVVLVLVCVAVGYFVVPRVVTYVRNRRQP